MEEKKDTAICGQKTQLYNTFFASGSVNSTILCVTPAGYFMFDFNICIFMQNINLSSQILNSHGKHFYIALKNTWELHFEDRLTLQSLNLSFWENGCKKVDLIFRV